MRNPLRFLRKPKPKPGPPIVADPSAPPRWNGMPCETMIVPAFISGGIQYFMHIEIAGMAAGRAFSAIQFNEEHEMKVDKPYLDAFIKSSKEALNANDKVLAGHYLKVLEQRQKFIIEPDILYKLASVVFFDESENPFSYDPTYGAAKVEKWKEEEVEHFFYGTPMRAYLPSLATFESGLGSYIAAVRLQTAQELESFAATLSKNPQNSATVDYLTSQAGTRREWLRSNGYLSTSTTYS